MSGAVLFQNSAIGSSINFICFTLSTLCGGDTNRISVGVQDFGRGIARSGIQQIASAGEVPEAGTWALMLAGMGVAGGALRT